MIACTMPLESMWIGNLIPGLSMQEPHRDVPPDKVPPPKHPPDVIPFDPDEEPDFPPGGPPIKDPPPDPKPPPAAQFEYDRHGFEGYLGNVGCVRFASRLDKQNLAIGTLRKTIGEYAAG